MVSLKVFLERKESIDYVKNKYQFTCKCPTYIKIREKYYGLLGPSPTLP
jgi:hypothetical protein